MNREGSCGAGRAQIGRTLASALAAGACAGIGEVGEVGEIGQVSVAVATWVEQVGQFLGVVQAVLEQSRPSEDATAEVRAVAGQLPALIRQCRAQVPTPDMIHTWVQTLTSARRHVGDADAAAMRGALAPPTVPFMGGSEPPTLRVS